MCVFARPWKLYIYISLVWEIIMYRQTPTKTSTWLVHIFWVNTLRSLAGWPPSLQLCAGLTLIASTLLFFLFKCTHLLSSKVLNEDRVASRRLWTRGWFSFWFLWFQIWLFHGDIFIRVSIHTIYHCLVLVFRFIIEDCCYFQFVIDLHWINHKQFNAFSILDNWLLKLILIIYMNNIIIVLHFWVLNKTKKKVLDFGKQRSN